jgi:hypothetical protein
VGPIIFFELSYVRFIGQAIEFEQAAKTYLADPQL